MFNKTRSEIKRLNATKNAFKKLCSDCKDKAGKEALKGDKNAINTSIWCYKCKLVIDELNTLYVSVTDKVMEDYDEFSKRKK